MENVHIPYIWITLFLMICTLSDIFRAKVSNSILFPSFILTLLTVFFFYDFQSSLLHIINFLIMFSLGFVLFNFKVLGGADVKAMSIVALTLTPSELLYFVVYSLVWAAVYSGIYFLISGQILNLSFNTLGVYKKYAQATHKIPFMIGVFLGWLSLFGLGILQWT